MPKRRGKGRGCMTSAKYWDIVRLKYDWGDFETQVEIAARVGCVQSTVSNTMQRWLKYGDPLPPELKNKKADRRLGRRETQAMICMIENNPDMYIREIRDELQARFDRLLSCWRICRALRDNNFSVKVLERVAKERDAQLRFNWRETVRLLQHERLVFIDESHFDNNSVRRRRGRSRRGLPAIGRIFNIYKFKNNLRTILTYMTYMIFYINIMHPDDWMPPSSLTFCYRLSSLCCCYYCCYCCYCCYC